MPRVVSLMVLPTIAFHPALAADPPTIRAEIESTLGEMSRAALSADEVAFLSHIARDDAFLFTEWKHWADQLDTATPVEFALRIGDGPTTFDDVRAEFPLVISWLITTAPAESWGAGGKPREVTFPPVVFTKVDSDGPGPLAPRWLFRGERWERRECDGFTICYLPGTEKVVHEVFQAFPKARDHDNELFGVKPPSQVLKLYTSMDHLRATVYLNMPDPVLGGWNEKDESVKFMTTYTRGVEGWTNAYAHEYGHVCTWELGPEASRIQWWVTEGAAELAAQEFRPGYWARLDAGMRKDAAAGNLTPWADIADYITAPARFKGRTYTQGHHMIGFITDRWGPKVRNDWLRAMAAGKTLDEACRECLGREFSGLDREWREELMRPEAANNPDSGK